ncbi:MAG: class I SAM-dependent methyltransferase [Lysobacterales bacterium]
MDFQSYSSFWNTQASTDSGALAAVDGSASEAIVRLTGRWTADQVRTALELDSSHRVLELGCGVGRIGRQLADTVAGWHGVDISSNMLSVAAERLNGINGVSFSQLHRTSLDMLEDNAFERAYTVAVLCHMDKEDLFLYLKEMKRVMTDGGLAYLETWNLDHPMGWKRWQLEVDEWARSDQSVRKNVARNQFCTPDEFSLYVRQAGLQVISCYGDSPWVQVVAGNELSDEALAAHQQRIAAVESQVAYSDQWGKLFGRLLDVIYGIEPPATFLAELDAMNQDPEVALYRDYLLALWAQHAEHWGPVKAE